MINTYVKRELIEALGLVENVNDNDLIKLSFTDSETCIEAVGESIQISRTIQHTSGLLEGKAKPIIFGATYLHQAISNLSSAEMIELSGEDQIYTLTDNKRKYKINTYWDDAFPKTSFQKKETALGSVTLKKDTLIECIDKTISWAEPDNKVGSKSGVLKGVNISVDGSRMTFTATDSYRLARKIIDVQESSMSVNATVPAATLKLIKTIPGDEITLNFYGSAIQIEGDKCLIQSRLLGGNYPEVDRLIPTAFAAEVSIAKDEFAQAVNSASIIKNDRMSLIKMEMSDQAIVISSKSQEFGDFSQDLCESGAVFTGEAMKLYFSGGYMKTALRSIDGSKIKLSFNGSLKPFVIGDGTVGETFLLLPLRAYE